MAYRLRITEDEVREELAQMGYVDVSDEMIASFRKDLLKMIKNDLRKFREERVQTDTDVGTHGKLGLSSISRKQQSIDGFNMMPQTSTPLSPLLAHNSQKIPIRVVGDNEAATESGYSDRESEASSSIQSSCGGRDRTSDFGSLSDIARAHPSLRIPADARLIGEHLRSPKKTVDKRLPSDLKKGFSSSRYSEAPSGSHPPVLKSSVSGRERRSQGCLPNKALVKEKRNLPSYPSRNDPVSLYHYYRAHWDKYKVPGEDPHSKLRWSIRTKLFYSS